MAETEKGQTTIEAVGQDLPSKPKKKRNHALVWLTLLLLILGGVWYLIWMLYLREYETTDNAYVNGYMINVSSVISGAPIAFFADNTDFVEEGQLLVLLDPTPYQMQYEKELSNLTAIALQVRQTYDNVEVSQLNVKTKQVQVQRARFDFENRNNLRDLRAVSREDYVHARDTLAIAELELQQAKQQLRVAQAAAGPTPMEKHPTIEQQKANVRVAYYNLKHCTIVSPATGYVAQRAVEVGQWIAPNTPLMMVVPVHAMWIDANFKETQLKNVRIGQPVTVTFDLYGGNVDFKGEVIGISSGTGSVFSLIPPQNATGNWIKIVQRLPVRIALNTDQMKQFPLRLGLSSHVSINISNTDLPVLADVASRDPIFTTSVFNYHFEEINQLMDQLLEPYLKNSSNEKQL